MKNIPSQENRLNKAVGARLRAAREAAGMTQSDFSNRSEITQARVSSIERGQQWVTMQHISAYSQVLNVRPEVLLTGEDIEMALGDLAEQTTPDLGPMLSDDGMRLAQLYDQGRFSEALHVIAVKLGGALPA